MLSARVCVCVCMLATGSFYRVVWIWFGKKCLRLHYTCYSYIWFSAMMQRSIPPTEGGYNGSSVYGEKKISYIARLVEVLILRAVLKPTGFHWHTPGGWLTCTHRDNVFISINKGPPWNEVKSVHCSAEAAARRGGGLPRLTARWQCTSRLC